MSGSDPLSKRVLSVPWLRYVVPIEPSPDTVYDYYAVVVQDGVIRDVLPQKDCVLRYAGKRMVRKLSAPPQPSLQTFFATGYPVPPCCHAWTH